MCRVSFGEESAVVKIHLARGLRSRLAPLLRLDPAQREARALHAALQADLPVPRPIAVGRHACGETRLLLEDLGDGPTLADLLEKGPLPPARIRRIALLTAELHQAGLLHTDLHPGNLLFPGGGERAFLLDLQAARSLDRPLSPREREKALVFLWLSARRRLPKSQGLLFLRAYCRAFPWPSGESLPALGTRLEAAAHRLQRKTWIRREDRPFRDCSEFLKKEVPRGNLFLAKVPAPPSLSQVQTLLEEGRLQFLRKGRRGFVARGGGWIFKERDERHARTLWLAHYRLRQREIPAPEALLLILQKGRGTLVCRDLGSLPDLARALEQAPGPAQREALLHAAARLTASLHATGLRNRDLKAGNLLVRETPAGPVLLPVDLDGLSRPRRLRLSHIAGDLARLAASLTALGLPWNPLIQAYLQAIPQRDPFLPSLDSLENRIASRLVRLGPRP